MGKGIFVTATSTGVGKTTVVCGILHSLRKRGIDAAAFKPIETGANDIKVLSKDSDAGKIALTLEAGLNNPHEFSMYRLRQPLAPFYAARYEHKTISVSKIYRRIFKIKEEKAILIVEGSGGIRVPITEKYDMIDLIKKTGFPVIVVSDIELGTINHTAMSAEILRNNGVRVVGAIYVERKEDGIEIAKKNNAEWIKNLYKIPVLGIIKYKRVFKQMKLENQNEWTNKHIDVDLILREAFYGNDIEK